MKAKLASLWLVVALVFVSQTECATDDVASVTGIHPTPKLVNQKSSEEIVIDDSWVIVANQDSSQSRFNADFLKHQLGSEFGLSLEIITQSDSRAKRTNRIVLARKDNSKWLNKFLNKNAIIIPETFNEEGYLIDVVSDGPKNEIAIIADTEKGIFYGVQSLLHKPNGEEQLLNAAGGGTVSPIVRIEDWPDRPVRGVFGLLSRDDSLLGEVNDLSDAFEWVDTLARLKMNTIVVGRWLEQLGDLEELYAYARQRYMVPVPHLRGLAGGAWEFVEEDPRIAEGFQVAGESFKCDWDGNDYVAQPIIPVDQTGRIENAGFEDGIGPAWSASSADFLSIDTTIVREGAASLAYYKPSATDSGSGTTVVKLPRENLVPVSAGEVISVSISVRADDVAGSFPKLIVRQMTEAFVNTPGTAFKKTTTLLHDGTYEWRTYEQSVLVADATRYLEVSLTIGDEVSGKLWIDNVEIKRLNGALINVIRTETTDIVVRDSGTGSVFSEGSDYFIDDGDFRFLTNVEERKIRFYTGVRPSRVVCSEGGEIDRDREFQMDFDFNVQMVKGQFKNPNMSQKEPQVYDKHVLPYIREMVEILDPSYVLYSGASEVKGINRDSRSGDHENYELLQFDINTVYSYLKELQPALRIYLWDDMLNPWHNGGRDTHNSEWGGGKTGAFESRDPSIDRVTDDIPRTDLIIWSWWYSQDAAGKIANSPTYFSDKGFTWIGSPYQDPQNIYDWVAQMTGSATNLGMILWSPFYSNPGNVEYASERAWSLVQQ